MTAVPKNIYIEQGATFRLAWTYYPQALDVDGNPVFEDDDVTPVLADDPYDLTGCTARCQVRQNPSSTDPWLTATTDADDGITLGGTAGTVVLEFTDEKSEAMGVFARDKVGAWDFKLYWPSGDEDRLVEGVATISPSVTRDAE